MSDSTQTHALIHNLLQTPIYGNMQYACVLPNKYHHLNFSTT